MRLQQAKLDGEASGGALVSQLNARPADVRAFLDGTLDPERSRKLTERLREAGVPI